MPIYEYECLSCGCEFEVRRSIADARSLMSCTSCGGNAKRLISTFGAKNGLYVRAAGRKAFRGNSKESNI